MEAAQRGKFCFVQPGHDQQGGTGVEVVAVAAEPVAAPAGMVVLLDYGDMQTAFCQVDRGGNSANARANDNYVFCFHFSNPRMLRN
jgi:hypothetical protein